MCDEEQIGGAEEKEKTKKKKKKADRRRLTLGKVKVAQVRVGCLKQRGEETRTARLRLKLSRFQLWNSDRLAQIPATATAAAATDRDRERLNSFLLLLLL